MSAVRYRLYYREIRTAKLEVMWQMLQKKRAQVKYKQFSLSLTSSKAFAAWPHIWRDGFPGSMVGWVDFILEVNIADFIYGWPPFLAEKGHPKGGGRQCSAQTAMEEGSRVEGGIAAWNHQLQRRKERTRCPRCPLKSSWANSDGAENFPSKYWLSLLGWKVLLCCTLYLSLSQKQPS